MYGPMSMFPPRTPSTPICCGCISMRFGCVIICVIWGAFSMYMAVLSFQNTSLFFTYMTNAPVNVYGVLNLILAVIAIGGILILSTGSYHYFQSLSHALFVAVFCVLADAFANLVVFITEKDTYQPQCVEDASTRMIAQVNSTGFDSKIDYYNCAKLWQDELKFSIIFFALQFSFYFYWCLCIYSFSLVLRGYLAENFRSGDGSMMTGAPPPPGVAIPPNVMINTPGNDRQVIVLNNTKPSSKTKKRIDTFSFKSIKPSSANTVNPAQQPMGQMNVPYGARDSLLKLGFRLGPHGNIIDIENAPQVIDSTAQQQLNRKPIKTEHDNKSYY